ncbi:MAG: phosphoribosyltransferase [Oligoflexia bacterium]|nr:phosphoribosyltransferase [Oligoflexia bacterium]
MSMSAQLWQKLDIEVVQNPPPHIEKSDHCYYAREYLSGKGYQASDTNQLIMNFKKDPSKKLLPEWEYKIKAQKKFAEELAFILPGKAEIAAIPTSKCKSDSSYDSRFEETFDLLTKRRPDVVILNLLQHPASVDPLHLKGVRSIEGKLSEIAMVSNITPTGEQLFLIDDVLTTGVSFKACQKKIREKFPQVLLVGIFWALSIR